MSERVRVRFAPSPTGYLHVGGARTALFNWLYARQTGGAFILRMEDTDDARNTEAARLTIFEGLQWLGLEPDEGPELGGAFGPYSQSERGELYAREVASLKASGAVYPCFCTRERLQSLREAQIAARENQGYDQHCRDLEPAVVARRIEGGEVPTWRLRVPEGETVLDDVVRGRVTVAHADVEDIILVRADGTPIYNLAVVIDDHQMEITHVLRGEDHLTNTFKQLILFKALGWKPPIYGHLPLILGPTGEGKLSKRKHPEAALEHYTVRGFPPDAVVNWLALIGWSFDDKTEVMTREELIERFSLERIGKSGARLNLEKLNAMSSRYVQAMEPAALASALTPYLPAHALRPGGPPKELYAEGARPRISAFSDAVDLFAWLSDPLEFDPKAQKNLTKDPDGARWLRDYAATLIEPLSVPSDLEALARRFAESRDLAFGKFVHPVRAALTGRTAGVPLFDCLVMLGKEKAQARLNDAADALQSGRWAP